MIPLFYCRIYLHCDLSECCDRKDHLHGEDSVTQVERRNVLRYRTEILVRKHTHTHTYIRRRALVCVCERERERIILYYCTLKVVKWEHFDVGIFHLCVVTR